MASLTGHITDHFTWPEFLKPGRPLPDKVATANLKRLAEKLEEVRKHLGGKAIIVTSGYRDPVHNAAVGGVRNSTHTKGMAADIVVVGMSPKQVQAKLAPWWPGGLGAYNTFTHLDIRPRRYRW